MKAVLKNLIANLKLAGGRAKAWYKDLDEDTRTLVNIAAVLAVLILVAIVV